MRTPRESEQPQQAGETTSRVSNESERPRWKDEAVEKPVTFLPRFIWERWPSEFSSTE